MFRNVVFRIIAGLFLLAAIAGIAFFAYQAGVTHAAVANLQPPVIENGVPFYPHDGMHHFMRFDFFGVLFVFFLLFLAFGAMRRMIWGPRWGWRHMHRQGSMGYGPWGEKAPGECVPSMFEEWHRRAHGQPEESSNKKSEL